MSQQPNQNAKPGQQVAPQPRIQTRLPVPHGVQPKFWKILTEVIFPAARDPNMIMLAVEYCAHRRLDILKRPVNIVPNWNSQLGRMVEGIWPSINEIEVTASRSGEYGGCDKPVFGPEHTETFKGRIQVKGVWKDVAVEVTYPETCDVTVYRIVKGIRCPFTVTVYWLEEYGRIGASQVPNGMWRKRTHDQFGKVGRAASLRTAFPEDAGGPTSEEMEGKPTEDPDVVVEASEATAGPSDDWQPPEEIEGEIVVDGAAKAERTEEAERATSDESATGAKRATHDESTKVAERQATEKDSTSANERANVSESTKQREREPAHDTITGEVIDADTVIGKLELDVSENNVETWVSWAQRFLVRINHAPTLDHINEWLRTNNTMLASMKQDAEKTYRQVEAAVNKRRNLLATADQEDKDGGKSKTD